MSAASAGSEPSLARWRVSFAVVFGLVLIIGCCAYQGWTPNVEAIHPDLDLLLHALLIGATGGLFDGALGFRPVCARWPFLRLGPLLFLLAAGLEELLQDLSPNRSTSLDDFLADLMGVLIFSWLFARIERGRRRKLSLNPPD